MKRDLTWVIFTVLAVISITVARTNQTYPERLMDDFADPKEAYAMLLDGVVAHQGDSVIFDLLPAVGFSTDRKDRIIVISQGDSCEFTREPLNDSRIPNPLGKGKVMKAWQTKADYCPDTDGVLAEKEKKFFKVFADVVYNGKITYSAFGSEEKLIKNFISTYKEDPEKADKLAKKVSDPLFSW